MPFVLECKLITEEEKNVWHSLVNKKYKYVIWTHTGDTKITFRSTIERDLFVEDFKAKVPYINFIYTYTKPERITPLDKH